MVTPAHIGNLRICIYPDDHHPAHFHVIVPDHEAMISLGTLDVLQGRIRRRDLSIAVEWARENSELLEREWSRLNGR